MSYYDKDNPDAAARISRYPGPGLNSVAEYQQSGRPFLQVAAPTSNHNNNGAAGVEAFTAAGNKIKGDSVTVEFPFITKRVTIKNLTANVAYVYFSSLRVPVLLSDGDADGDAITQRGDKVVNSELATYMDGGDDRPESATISNGHYFELAVNEEVKMDIKCKRLYLAGVGGGDGVRVYGELTNIVHPYNLDLRGIEGISGGTAGSVTS